MYLEKLIKETKMYMAITFIIGIVLAATGIIFRVGNLDIVENSKGLVGLSFIPLAISLTYLVKLLNLTKSPDKTREMVVNETDERLVGLKNEVDSKAFKLTQMALCLAYMGYTFTQPQDIFESMGWWLIMILLFLTFVFQGIVAAVLRGKITKVVIEDDEE